MHYMKGWGKNLVYNTIYKNLPGILIMWMLWINFRTTCKIWIWNIILYFYVLFLSPFYHIWVFYNFEVFVNVPFKLYFIFNFKFNHFLLQYKKTTKTFNSNSVFAKFITLINYEVFFLKSLLLSVEYHLICNEKQVIFFYLAYYIYFILFVLLYQYYCYCHRAY